jgi:GT2 family glycosyltransferase
MPDSLHRQDFPRIAVVTVNYHGVRDTLECLQSLQTQLDEHTFAIVVDNDSPPNEISDIRAAFPAILTIANPVNEGYAGGNNRGIELALQQDADWVLLLNNDTIVSDAIFRRLRAAIAATKFSILGVVINEFHDRSQVQTEGVRFNPKGTPSFFQSISLPIANTDPPTVTEVDIVNGCAVMISRSVFETIGLIDERFFLICEESDFCLRAQAAGFKLGVVHETHVWHKHSVTFAKAGKPLQRYFGTRNLWLLLTKHWGGAGRRGLVASLLFYFRHTYHLFCHERELGNKVGAEAMMIGVRDALLGRYGNRPIQSSLFARLLVLMATVMWRLRGGRETPVIENEGARS